MRRGLNGMSLKGITSPYLYVGGTNTIFACHTEDYDLASINILHEGCSKFWYCFREKDFKKVLGYVKEIYPEAFLNCNQYLRHKTLLINPYKLKQRFPELTIEKYFYKI